MEMKISFSGGKKVDADYKGFIIKTDQPIDERGEGSAPEPFSLFIASIGTCTGVYVLSFCQERGIPTDDITLLLHMEENNETHMIKKISIEIKVPEFFPENYKKAIVKTASLCTVTKHLDNPPEIDIFLTKS